MKKNHDRELRVHVEENEKTLCNSVPSVVKKNHHGELRVHVEENEKTLCNSVPTVVYKTQKNKISFITSLQVG
ncbi:hypothetical protein JCM31826_19800 [Thermaurantimonas aggregans]|uniref:Uncharacterized protein n=1 Tax=Thermaurantimonas aggregans TaxID=2173829 RepID=A0A401XNA5_9FLAO|nr:hypothetical protein JCM31826_19800 [Thermaurantimonas aggregans]